MSHTSCQEEQPEQCPEEILYEVPELNSVNLPVDRRRQLVTLRGDIKGRRLNVLIDSGSMLDLIRYILGSGIGSSGVRRQAWLYRDGQWREGHMQRGPREFALEVREMD
jgi:hypothetical protein